MYNQYFKNYKETGLKPEFWKLLFILLLDKRDSLEYHNGEKKVDFYKRYKEMIDLKIKKILLDFEIYNNDFKKIYGIEIENENIDKLVWTLFERAITSIIFVLDKGKELTIEEIYNGYNIGEKEITKLKKFSKIKNTKKFY